MFKSTAKNIIVVVIWVLMITFSASLLIYYHIPSSYVRTPYNVVSSTYIPAVTSTQHPYHQIKATYTANNGKTYPINLQYSDVTNNGQDYVYYDPSNPAMYKAASPDPTAVDFIPVGIAALVTFLVYSKITFLPTAKKKKKD